MKRNFKKLLMGLIVVGTIFNVSIPQAKAQEDIDPPVLPRFTQSINIKAEINRPVLHEDINECQKDIYSLALH